MKHCFTTRKTKEGIVIKGLSTYFDYDTSYQILPDGTVEIIIPHVLDGIPVVGIDDNAFKNQQNISIVTIGRHVKRIGKATFAGCELLREVILHEGVQVIGERAFMRCTSLEVVKIPKSVEVIDNEAFLLCKSLKFISVGHTQTVADTAFIGCAELKHIYDEQNIEKLMSTKKPHMFKIGASSFRTNLMKDGYICFDIGQRGVSAVPKFVNGKPVHYVPLANSLC